MRSLILQAFTKSLAMTMLSEVGNGVFCVATILAMRYPRKSVLLGCLVSVVEMTGISALVEWISRKWSHHVTTFLFCVFSLRSVYQGFAEDDDDSEELAEVEKEPENDPNPVPPNRRMLLFPRTMMAIQEETDNLQLLACVPEADFCSS